MTAPERKPLHALVSPESHAGYLNLADDMGVTMTGLLEVLGLALSDPVVASRAGVLVRPFDLEKMARRIDADRRSRQGGYR